MYTCGSACFCIKHMLLSECFKGHNHILFLLLLQESLHFWEKREVGRGKKSKLKAYDLLVIISLSTYNVQKVLIRFSSIKLYISFYFSSFPTFPLLLSHGFLFNQLEIKTQTWDLSAEDHRERPQKGCSMVLFT